ncbi:MAG: glycosyltransferase family 39 protein [Planctomycetes bacterium]|nr:glycosyltransferase family 39 protein [Planctomycetota bacterium]
MALLLAGFALRWPGVGWGLPQQTYRDGMVLSTQVELLRGAAADPGANEFWGYYPHLLSRVVATCVGDYDAALSEPLDLSAHLARASEPWLTARQVSVLASLLAVPAAFFVARRFVSSAWAVFAAALVTMSIFHISFGQQEKPHGPISALVPWAVLAAVELRRRPCVAWWTLATVSAALAIATLQSGFFALGSAGVAVALLLRGSELNREGHVSRRRLVAIGLVATAVVLGGTVRIFYPFHFDEHVERAVVESGMSLGGHPVDFAKFNFAGARNMFVTLYLFEPVLLALSAIGLVVFAVRRLRRVGADVERRRDLLVMCGFVVPYSVMLCVYEDAFDRFLMPLVPFLAALAAYGAAALVARASKPIALAVAALALVEPAAASWRMGRVRAHPDTQAQVAQWIRENARPEDKVYVYPYVDLPLFYSEAAVAELGDDEVVLTWMGYQTRIARQLKLGPAFTVIPPGNAKQELAELGQDPLGRLRARGARFVVIQALGERYRQKVLVKLREQLSAECTRVFRASPFEGAGRNGRVWIRYAMTLDQEPAWWRLFREVSVGTTLEVYALDTPRSEASK